MPDFRIPLLKIKLPFGRKKGRSVMPGGHAPVLLQVHEIVGKGETLDASAASFVLSLTKVVVEGLNYIVVDAPINYAVEKDVMTGKEVHQIQMRLSLGRVPGA